MTTEHLLQYCPLRHGPRSAIWLEVTFQREKLHGDLAEFKRTAAFVKVTGVGI